jgi:ADP-ribose pyrophosphatase
VKAQARIVSSRTVYEGRVVALKLESLVEPGGVIVRREVVCHPGSVVMLPCFPDGSVLLVRQYRHAARQSLWELPAGTLEPNENPRHAAQRELAEETGYQARQLKLLGEFFPSPGILSEKMRLFEASGLVPSRARPDADERIRVHRFSRRELRRMVRAGRIHDGKTLVGLLWFLQGAERERPRR